MVWMTIASSLTDSIIGSQRQGHQSNVDIEEFKFRYSHSRQFHPEKVKLDHNFVRLSAGVVTSQSRHTGVSVAVSWSAGLPRALPSPDQVTNQRGLTCPAAPPSTASDDLGRSGHRSSSFEDGAAEINERKLVASDSQRIACDFDLGYLICDTLRLVAIFSAI